MKHPQLEDHYRMVLRPMLERRVVPFLGAGVNLCGRPQDPLDLKKLKGKAIHVHISDCDGKVHGDLPPGRGIVKFEPYLQAIKELKITGVISIELEYPPDPKRIVEWVTEAYAQTDKLMQLAGLRG